VEHLFACLTKKQVMAIVTTLILLQNVIVIIITITITIIITIIIIIIIIIITVILPGLQNELECIMEIVLSE